jgi:O-antigen ligase
MLSIKAFQKNSKWPVAIITVLAILLGASIGIIVEKASNLTYVLAATAGLVVVLITIANTEFGLLVFVFTTYIRASDILVHDYGAPSIARALIALLVLSIVLKWATSGNLPKGWLTAGVLVLAYGVVIFSSLIYANSFTDALTAVSDYWKDGLIAILVVALVQNKQTFTKVLWALLFCGLLVGSLSVYQFLTSTFSNNYWGLADSPVLNIIGETEGNRVAGPIGDPNFYAQILVVLVPIAINRLVFSKNIVMRILAGITAAVCTLAVFYTYSRGGLIALIAAIIALIIFRPPNIRTMVILIAIGILSLTMLPENFIDRMATVTGLVSGQQDPRSEISIRGRTSEMLSAVNMFLDHPILGVGAENYPSYYQQYARKLGLDNRAEPRQPHNLYLQVAAETGILGILVFGAVLVYIYRSIRNSRAGFRELEDNNFRDLIGAFAAGVIGYLSAAMFIHGAYPRYFWLLAGIAMSLPQVLKNEAASIQKETEA